MEQQNPPMNAVTNMVSTDFANTVQIHDNENGIDSQVNNFRRPYCKKNPPRNPPKRAPEIDVHMFEKVSCGGKYHKKECEQNEIMVLLCNIQKFRMFLWPNGVRQHGTTNSIVDRHNSA